MNGNEVKNVKLLTRHEEKNIDWQSFFMLCFYVGMCYASLYIDINFFSDSVNTITLCSTLMLFFFLLTAALHYWIYRYRLCLGTPLIPSFWYASTSNIRRLNCFIFFFITFTFYYTRCYPSAFENIFSGLCIWIWMEKKYKKLHLTFVSKIRIHRIASLSLMYFYAKMQTCWIYLYAKKKNEK